MSLLCRHVNRLANEALTVSSYGTVSSSLPHLVAGRVSESWDWAASKKQPPPSPGAEERAEGHFKGRLAADVKQGRHGGGGGGLQTGTC